MISFALFVNLMLMQIIVVRRKAVAFHINIIPGPGPGMSRSPLLRHRNGAVLLLRSTRNSISKSTLYMAAFDDNRQDRHQPDEDEDEDEDEDGPECFNTSINTGIRRDELTKLEITQILSKLREYDVRISPTATRTDLIQLIIDHEKLQLQNRQERDVDADADAIPTEISEGGVGRRRSTNIPKRRMMREDDDNDSIRDESRGRGPPSRLPKRRENDVRSSSGSSRSRSRNRNQSPTRQARSRREVRRERNNPSEGVWDDALGVFMPTAKEAAKWGLKAVDGVTNVAKVTTDDLGKRLAKLKRSRRPIDQDSNGVKEADWYYVSKDEQLMRSRAPAGPPTPTRLRKKKPSKKKAYRPDARRRPKEKSKRRVRVDDEIDEYETNVGQNGNKLLALPPTLENVVYIPDLSKGSKSSQDNEEVGSIPKIPIYYEEDRSSGTVRNASGNATGDMRDGKGTQRRVKKRSSSNTQTTRQKNDRTKMKKKAYSVYPQGEDDFEFDSFLYGKRAAGAIDSVGEFLADVTSGDYGTTNRTVSSREGIGSKRTTKRKYWKDRLAERVDYALGVHEDGAYNRSWQDRMEKNRERESEGNDPLSIFYGKQKKKRLSKKAGPFWEEDGSLMSLLFGRNSDGQQLTFNVSSCNFILLPNPQIITLIFILCEKKILERDFSVSHLLSTTFKSTLAVLSYVCRWASCRGALPQPIVVFVLAASAISAPRRKKLITVALALVATRTLAEALHGYVYGNEDWEDDELISHNSTEGHELKED